MKYQLPDDVVRILDKFKKNRFEIYVVGGCVRDILMDRKTNDWDFTTNAKPSEILELYPEGFYDNQFGTVGVTTGKSKLIYEITTFRQESDYKDHRHPEKIIWGTNLLDDLGRRDFTINALAYDGSKIIDPYNGKQDIKNKLIKAVRNPFDRFKEDALRMMRAIRIAAELNFSIDNETFQAITDNSKLIINISEERIRDEIIKILSSDYPADGIMLLKNAGLLIYILPEVEKCFGVEQKSPQRHHIYDVGTHLIMSLKHCPSKDPIVRLATLLHDVGKPVTFKLTEDGVITFYNHEIIGDSIVRNIANRLHLSKKDRDKLITLVRWHQFSVDERQTDKALRRFIKNVGIGNLKDILDLRIGDRLGGGARETSWRLELFKKRLIEVQKQPFTVADLKVDGNDIMKIYEIGPGPLVGAVLEMLFNDVIVVKIPNERDFLLKRIEELKKESKVNASSSPILPKLPKEGRH